MPKVSNLTRESMLAAALDLVRQGGPAALTARNLSAALHCGLNPIFTAFGSMESLLLAVRAEARKLFDARLQDGFRLNPPFKGFGIAFLWFAMDEPELYKLIMRQTVPTASFQDYIEKTVGYKTECKAVIIHTFGLKEKEAEALYFQMLYLALGLAGIMITGSFPHPLQAAAEIFGKSIRAFVMEIKAGSDAREAFIPSAGPGPKGSVGSYIDSGAMMHALVSQNHLLASLHEAPRYITDEQWAQIERVTRMTFELSAESLRKQYPAVTKGDVRLLILSKFHFSVADAAVLLGISPTSVTKARQRLKRKLGIDNIETFTEKL